ncbi:mitochondrial fission 1 protein isoform X1 [Macaca mulatta]
MMTSVKASCCSRVRRCTLPFPLPSGLLISHPLLCPSPELLPKGSKEEQRDYVFYLAVGNYRLKEYEKALKYVRGLLQTEPQNNQAKELERLIDKAMKKDGLVGMAIVGGMALGVAGLAGLIGLAVSKSKS